MPTLSPAAVALGPGVDAEIPSADPAAVARFIRAELSREWVGVTVRTVRDPLGGSTLSRAVLIIMDLGGVENAVPITRRLRALGVPFAFRHDYSAGEAECSVRFVDAEPLRWPLTVSRALDASSPLDLIA